MYLYTNTLSLSHTHTHIYIYVYVTLDFGQNNFYNIYFLLTFSVKEKDHKSNAEAK